MKLHCHRPSLASAFQNVSAIVPSRTPKDVLRNLKMQIEGGKATLIGTDQEVGIRHEIPGVETDSTGEVLLPKDRLLAILRELTTDGVDLEVDDKALWVRSGQSEFRLSVEDPAEYPPVQAFDAASYFVVPGSAFKEMIKRTIFATDEESTRYALGGVLLEFRGEQLTMAATDSRRLAVVSTKCGIVGNVEERATHPVVPTKALSLIERTIQDDDSEVYISLYPNSALFKVGSSTIYSRLVEGRFPRYNDVIPAPGGIEINLLVSSFYSAVRQAQIVTSEESRGVDFTFEPGTLRLTSIAADVGQSKVEIPISFEGPALTITFDPRFLADFLKVLDPSSTVKFQLTNRENAAVLRTDDGYIYVIMPLSPDH
jgi:DNA polymerase-3 subunit beta